MKKLILDACCGSKMFWFDKNHPNVVFMDYREIQTCLCDKRKLIISPDVVGDFRHIPYPDGTFRLVVFDPPHLINVGKQSWLAYKYGWLHKDTWQDDLRHGFAECFRVLEANGVLVFKWSEIQISVSDVVKLSEIRPLFGQRRGKTVWMVFMKFEEEEHEEANS